MTSDGTDIRFKTQNKIIDFMATRNILRYVLSIYTVLCLLLKL